MIRLQVAVQLSELEAGSLKAKSVHEVGTTGAEGAQLLGEIANLDAITIRCLAS